MKSALRVSFFMAVAIVGFLPQAYAEDPAQMENIHGKLDQLERNVSAIKAGQEKMSHKQSAIDEELASLKIWIRRHRG